MPARKKAAFTPDGTVTWNITPQEASIVARCLEGAITASSGSPGQAINNAKAVLPIYDSLMNACQNQLGPVPKPEPQSNGNPA